MKNTHDVVIIGAGPAAVATLFGLPSNMDVGVIYGQAAVHTTKSPNMHPKIAAIAMERGESAGMSAPLFFENESVGSLSNTSIKGGLANYWGQVFTPYAANDPWPRDIFDSYEEYIATCRKLHVLFHCAGLALDQSPMSLSDGYSAYAPRLLVGTRNEPPSGLLAMRYIIDELISQHRATQYLPAAIRFEQVSDRLCIHLEDGTVVSTQKAFLAAGTVASMRLLLDSDDDAQSVQLADHAPVMHYFLNTSGEIKFNLGSNTPHFNQVTFERILDDQVHLFASGYRMSHSSIGLLLSALGLPSILPNTRPPRVVDIINPIQVWTPSTVMQYRVIKGESKAQLIDRNDITLDNNLNGFRAWLRAHGKILKTSTTPPGFGFHYHAGEISTDGEHFIGVENYLDQRYRGKLICTDASILRSLGARPHTLTAMAAASAVANRWLL